MLWIALLFACGPEWSFTGDPEPAAIPAVRVENNVIALDVVTVNRGVPKRYVEPWPADSQVMRTGRYPVAEHWSHQICRGGGDGRERFAAAVMDAEGRGADLDAWGQMVWNQCKAPDYCEWVGSRLDSEPGNQARALWFFALQNCEDPSLKARFEVEHAPWGAVANWSVGQAQLDQPIPTQALIRALEYGLLSGGTAPAAVAALGEADSPEVAAGLLSLWSGMTHPEYDNARLEIAFAMAKQSDPEARGVYQAACAARPGDYRCEQTDPLQDLPSSVMSYQIEPSDLLRDYPNHRSAILYALADCYELAVDYTVEVFLGQRCLTAAAEVDRALAVDMIEERGDDSLPDPPGLEPLIRQFQDYPEEGALLSALIGWGLVPEGSDADGVTAIDLMVDAGVAIPIQQPGIAPVSRTLAARVGGLDDVVFATWEPDLNEELPLGHEPRTLMQAFMDGKRHQLLAPRGVDGTHLELAVGLVNALLEKRELPQRIAMLGDEHVYVGDPKGVLPALEAGLFPVYLPLSTNLGYGDY